MHMIEIIFKDLFFAIDGKPSGPKTYTSPIGKVIGSKNDSWKMKDKEKIIHDKNDKDYSWWTADKVIRFKDARKGLVKEKPSKLPNHDDNVLEQLCQLVQHGPDSKYKDAINLTPGQNSLSRWKNLAANFSLYFVMSETHTVNELLLMDIILNFYVPVLDEIKANPHFTNGPKHLFFTIKLLRDVLQNHKSPCESFANKKDGLYDIGKNAVLRNCYWGQYEHIQMAKMLETDQSIRKEAIEEYIQNQKYQKNRLKKNPNCLPRKFKLFPNRMRYNEATNYMELFDATDLPPRFRTNFPLCQLFSVEEWKQSIHDGPLVFSIDVPCHRLEIGSYFSQILYLGDGSINICSLQQTPIFNTNSIFPKFTEEETKKIRFWLKKSWFSIL